MDTFKALIPIPFVSDYFFLSCVSVCHISYAHRILHEAALWSGSRKLFRLKIMLQNSGLFMSDRRKMHVNFIVNVWITGRLGTNIPFLRCFVPYFVSIYFLLEMDRYELTLIYDYSLLDLSLPQTLLKSWSFYLQKSWNFKLLNAYGWQISWPLKYIKVNVCGF